MRIEEVLTLFDYNYWADERVLRTAAKLSLEQFTATAPVSQGSVRGALVHTLGAEQLYRMRCQAGISPNHLLEESRFSTQAELHAYWTDEEREMRAYLGAMTESELDRVVSYRTTSGLGFTNRVWEMLLQAIIHGVQTRSEAAVILTGYGHSPGGLDLIVFLRERPGGI